MLDKRKKENYKNQEARENRNPIDLEEILDFDFYLDDIVSLNEETIDEDVFDEDQDESPLSDVISYRDVLPDSEFADEDEEVQFKDLKDAEIVEPKPKKVEKAPIIQEAPPQIENKEDIETESLDSEVLDEIMPTAHSEEDLRVNEQIEDEDNIEVDKEFLNKKEKVPFSQESENDDDDEALDSDEIDRRAHV
jgi:hypothetical protein